MRKLALAAESWQGTRFHPRISVKGVGTHCTGLIHALAIECGIPGAEGLEIPTAPMRYHEHHTASLVQAYLETLLKTKRLTRLDPPYHLPTLHSSLLTPHSPLIPGDLLGIRAKRTVHHLAQVVDLERAVHVDRKKGVLFVSLKHVLPLVQVAYRILNDQAEARGTATSANQKLL